MLEERYEAMGVGEYQEDYRTELRRGYQPTVDVERRWPASHGYHGRVGPNEGTEDVNSETWVSSPEAQDLDNPKVGDLVYIVFDSDSGNARSNEMRGGIDVGAIRDLIIGGSR